MNKTTLIPQFQSTHAVVRATLLREVSVDCGCHVLTTNATLGDIEDALRAIGCSVAYPLRKQRIKWEGWDSVGNAYRATFNGYILHIWDYAKQWHWRIYDAEGEMLMGHPRALFSQAYHDATKALSEHLTSDDGVGDDDRPTIPILVRP